MAESQSADALLAEIVTQLKGINSKLEELLHSNASNTESNTSPVDIMTLLSLPASYRPTVMALYKLKRGTASDISVITGRLRAHESALANALCRLGYVQKKKEGHTTYFFIEPKMEKIN